MYKYSVKSNIVLGVLSVLSLMAFLAVENGKIDSKQEWYEEKLEASLLSQKAAEHLKNKRLEKGVFIDVVNDPNQTALIGQEYTLITTDRGYIESKLSTTNPNFAAVIVQLLKDAKLKTGDPVAIAMTGSFPGFNISVMAACQTLKLEPIVITSVGASNFGANDPYYTWLDMENELFQSGIYYTKSVAASIGGGNDVGRGLSPEGRKLILQAIERNEVELINEKHLEESITQRLEIYNKESEGGVKAYINIGGGIASLGNTINGKLIPPGLTEYLPMRNYPVNGVIIQMGQQAIPIIHLLNVSQLTAEYGLPDSPDPLPDPGEGGIFVQEKYSIWITALATIILLGVIVILYLGERKRHRLGADPVPQVQAPAREETEDIPVV